MIRYIKLKWYQLKLKYEKIKNFIKYKNTLSSDITELR